MQANLVLLLGALGLLAQGTAAAVDTGHYLAPVPASMQYMAMNHDGQYSFGYTGLDASRQETRHHDGSVRGQYSYTNPDGKMVRVHYTADARNGFQAAGDGVPANNVVQAPPPATAAQVQQVQDTPAVQAARERFFETYARELARVTGGAAAAPANVEHSVTSTTSHSASPSSTGTRSQVVSSSSSSISSSGARDPTAAHTSVTAGLTSTGTGGTGSYTVAGFDSNHYSSSHSGFSQYSDPNQGKGQQGPGYFYYVGVGGSPYYIQAPPVRNTNIAVSVRAHELGAIPADAVHDAQTPRYGPHGNRGSGAAASRPVYVEIGKDYTLPLSAPSAIGGGASAQLVRGGSGGVYQVPYFRLPYYGYNPTFIY